MRVGNDIEISFQLRTWFGLSLTNGLADDGQKELLTFQMFGLGVYVAIPKFLTGDEMEESYGLRLDSEGIWGEFRDKVFARRWPWMLSFYRHWVWRCWEWQQVPPGTAASDFADMYRFPMVYLTKSGDRQEAKVALYIETMEWRRIGLMGLPWFNKYRRSIQFSFDREIGDEVRSWKGGVVASSAEMRSGENWGQTFSRHMASKPY